MVWQPSDSLWCLCGVSAPGGVCQRPAHHTPRIPSASPSLPSLPVAWLSDAHSRGNPRIPGPDAAVPLCLSAAALYRHSHTALHPSTSPISPHNLSSNFSSLTWLPLFRSLGSFLGCVSPNPSLLFPASLALAALLFCFFSFSSPPYTHLRYTGLLPHTPSSPRSHSLACSPAIGVSVFLRLGSRLRSLRFRNIFTPNTF